MTKAICVCYIISVKSCIKIHYFSTTSKKKVIINSCKIFYCSHCRGFIFKDTNTFGVVLQGGKFTNWKIPESVSGKFTGIIAYLRICRNMYWSGLESPVVRHTPRSVLKTNSLHFTSNKLLIKCRSRSKNFKFNVIMALQYSLQTYCEA